MLEQPDTRIAPPAALLERMRSTPGLAALVAEAQATWLSRAKAASASGGAAVGDHDGARSGSAAVGDHDGAASGGAAVGDHDGAVCAAVGDHDGAVCAAVGDHDGVASGGAAVGDCDGVGSVLPAWRAFEDAFPTFYEFTNRPR